MSEIRAVVSSEFVIGDTQSLSHALPLGRICIRVPCGPYFTTSSLRLVYCPEADVEPGQKWLLSQQLFPSFFCVALTFSGCFYEILSIYSVMV